MLGPVSTENTPHARLPKTVWALGFTSLFMDVSSELIHGLLPLFLVVNLGASAAVLGLVEGIAEAAANIARVFSGWLSDTLQRRKALAVAGYGLAAITKPLFPIASAVWLVLAARVLDRIGKGLRGAPRDALIADVTPAAQRGAAFGLRQSLDTAVWLVLAARVLDRIGKGLRGAPRDALIADVTPAAQRGAAFGLRQSLDT